MVATADPTLASLESLKDTSRWKLVPNVPIFVPHIRRHEDGEFKYEITEKELQQIADVGNAKAAEGDLGRIQIGHTVLARDEQGQIIGTGRQEEQPRQVGVFSDFRVGRFGPKQKVAILANFYYDLKHFDEAKEYKFRSAEYYHKPKEITAVALLKTDPELDMGMLLFQRDPKGECDFYSSKELPMAFADQVLPDEEKMKKEDEEFYEKMKRCYPKFHEQYGPGTPSATGVTVPEHAAMYGRQPEFNGNGHAAAPSAAALPAAPAALIRENAELYQKNAELTKQLTSFQAEYRQDRLAVQYERELRALDPTGRVIDIPEELKDMRGMSEPDAAKHMKRLERYAKTPVGQDLIKLDEGQLVAARGNEPATQYESQAAVELCTAMQEQGKAMTFEMALKEIKNRRGK